MWYPLLVERAVLPALRWFSSSRFWVLEQRMVRQERQPAERIRQRQWQAVQAVLASAYQNVPFYRERFDAAGLCPEDIRDPSDLLKLPPTTRQDVDANFPDRITSPNRPDGCRIAATSGTTAQRILVLQDFGKRDAMRAALAHSFRFCGQRLGARYVEIPPDVCNVQCGLKREPEPSLARYLRRTGVGKWKEAETWSDLRGIIERQYIYRQLVISSFAADGVTQSDTACAASLEQIRCYRPAVLKALPAYLLILARYIQRQQVAPPRLREIRPMGAVLSHSARKIIQGAFGCRVVEDYGSAELGGIGCECRAAQGLHLFTDLFYMEIVRNATPAEPGEIGRILLTDLTNKVMPLIRYDIGDLGSFLAGDCRCGRNTPRFKVLGRVGDAIATSSGQVFTEHDIANFLYSYPGVEWFQLTQLGTDRVDLKIVTAPTVSLPEVQLLSDLKSFLGDGVQLTLRKVRTILPETGGKYRFLKSNQRPRQTVSFSDMTPRESWHAFVR